MCKMQGAYDLVVNPVEFMKRKRKDRLVILDKNNFPTKCLMCNKEITFEMGNRTRLVKKDGKLYVIPMHYECAWNFTFKAIDRIGHEYNARRN